MKNIATLALAGTLLAPVAYAGSSEWVDGLGWVPATVVTTCLQAVGEEETDTLVDGKWDDFVGCVGSSYRK